MPWTAQSVPCDLGGVIITLPAVSRYLVNTKYSSFLRSDATWHFSRCWKLDSVSSISEGWRIHSTIPQHSTLRRKMIRTPRALRLMNKQTKKSQKSTLLFSLYFYRSLFLLFWWRFCPTCWIWFCQTLVNRKSSSAWKNKKEEVKRKIVQKRLSVGNNRAYFLLGTALQGGQQNNARPCRG